MSGWEGPVETSWAASVGDHTEPHFLPSSHYCGPRKPLADLVLISSDKHKYRISTISLIRSCGYWAEMFADILTEPWAFGPIIDGLPSLTMTDTSSAVLDILLPYVLNVDSAPLTPMLPEVIPLAAVELGLEPVIAHPDDVYWAPTPPLAISQPVPPVNMPWTDILLQVWRLINMWDARVARAVFIHSLTQHVKGGTFPRSDLARLYAVIGRWPEQDEDLVNAFIAALVNTRVVLRLLNTPCGFAESLELIDLRLAGVVTDSLLHQLRKRHGTPAFGDALLSREGWLFPSDPLECGEMDVEPKSTTI